MGARSSWAVGIDENTGMISVEDARLSMSALWTPTGPITSRSGLVPAADMPGAVTATSPTPNGEVHVAPFRAVLQSVRGGGTYTLCLDEIEDLDVLLAAPPDPANDRIVLVVFQQSDTYFLDPDSTMRPRLVVGDPAITPVDPEVTGSEDYLVRARITVRANATSIEPGDIEVLPLPWTVATGGILPVDSLAERDAITAPYDGFPIYRRDKGWIEVSDGASWRIRGVASIADFTDVTHPVTGQVVWHIGNRMFYRYNGSGWSILGTVGGRIAATVGSIHTGIAGTEVNIPKLAIENSRVIGGSFYVLNVNLYANFSAADNAFLIRVRKDTPLTGPVLAAWQWDSPLTGDDTKSVSQPWRAAGTDTDADFYVSVQRILGAGTMGIYGDRRSAFWLDDNGGDSAAWIEVP